VVTFVTGLLALNYKVVVTMGTMI